MMNLQIKPGITARLVRRTDNEVELDFGCATNYVITRNGSIISTNYRRSGDAKELSLINATKGYKHVLININSKLKSFKVHRLVGICFIPNPDNLPQINHKNEDKADNRVENLEWCDGRYNMNYGTRPEKGRIAMTNGKTSKPIRQLTLAGKIVRIWPSASEAKRNGYNHSHISQCCNKKRQTHAGFRWEYAYNNSKDMKANF